MAYRFKAHVILTGQITCVSGLHIGGTEEGYEIGGMEYPIIREKMTGYPYIPGSSLKGKMRSLMEWTLGKIEKDGRVHGRSCQDPQCQVCRIFGTSTSYRYRNAQATGPTRLIVRDAFPSQHTLDQFIQGGVFITEAKMEARLNRITSETNPHQIERVPKGAQFDLEMVYGIYDIDDQGVTDIQNLTQVYMALDLVEASVIGGGGSRGSGKIRIDNLDVTIKTFEEYQMKASGDEVVYTTVAGRQVNEVIAILQKKLGMTEDGGGTSE